MKNFTRFLCIAAAFYLGIISHGPVRRWFDEVLTSKTTQPAARVCGHPITRSQLERALSEQLWLEGKSAANLAPADLELSRAAALDELIDHELLRLQIKAISPQIPVSELEINERLHRLADRFESKWEVETAMKSQGIAKEQDLRDRLAAHIRQEKFIALRIGPAIRVTDEQVRSWFDANQSRISQPERVEARHIFIPTLDHPPEEAKQKLDVALVTLTDQKQDFATLAKELSEDPATKYSGGELGWMARDRLPADFAAPLFSMATGEPTLIRTKLGWHLVEVTDRKPSEPRTFEQAKPEIIAALETIKRHQATADLRESLRKSDAVKIEIY